MQSAMWLFSDRIHGFAFTVMLVKQNAVLKCLHYQQGNSNRMCVMYIFPRVLPLEFSVVINNQIGI